MVWALGLSEFGAISVQIAIMYMAISYLKHGSSYALARSSSEADYQILIYSLLSFALISIVIVPTLKFSYIMTANKVSNTFILVCILEGILRLLSEFFRGSKTILRFLFFILGDFGLKISLLISTVVIYFNEHDAQFLELFFTVILFLQFVRCLILLASVTFNYCYANTLHIEFSLHQYFAKSHFFAGLKKYWLTVGMSVLSEAGSSTILAIFLSRVQAIAGLETVGMIRLITQVVSLFNTPTSIIEGFISPTIRENTKNGTDFSRVRTIRYYLITINLLIFLFVLTLAIAINIFSLVHIVTQTFVFSLVILVLATFFRSILGSPFFMLLSLGNQMNKTYVASVTGIALTLIGLITANNLFAVIIIYATSLFIIDFLICAYFTIIKTREDSIDKSYFAAFNLIYDLRFYPNFISNAKLNDFFYTMKAFRD